MEVLRPIVLPKTTWPVKMAQLELIQGCNVGAKAIRRDDPGLHRLISEKASEQLQRGFRVPPALHDEVQNLAFVIDGSPQIHPLSADPADHLIKMPARRWSRPPALQPASDLRPELDRPAPDRLVAHVDAACRQKLFDIAQAETEAEVEPHGMADHLRRKAVALER